MAEHSLTFKGQVLPHTLFLDRLIVLVFDSEAQLILLINKSKALKHDLVLSSL